MEPNKPKILTCIMRVIIIFHVKSLSCQYGLEFCFSVTHSMYFIPPFLILFLPPEARRYVPEADICAFKLIQQ